MANSKTSKKDVKKNSDGDLAAMLRASLNEESASAPAPETKEEDELSRLLREQLERFQGSASKKTETLSYGGFNLDEFMEDPEEADMVFEDLPEASFEDMDEAVSKATVADEAPTEEISSKEAYTDEAALGAETVTSEEIFDDSEKTTSEEISDEELEDEGEIVGGVSFEESRRLGEALDEMMADLEAEEVTDASGEEKIQACSFSVEEPPVITETIDSYHETVDPSNETPAPAEAAVDTAEPSAPIESSIPARKPAATVVPEKIPSVREEIVVVDELPQLPERKVASFWLQEETEYDDEELNGRTHMSTLDRVMRGAMDEETREALQRMTTGEDILDDPETSADDSTDGFSASEDDVSANEAYQGDSLEKTSSGHNHMLPPRKKADGWHDPLQLTLNTVGSAPKKYIKVPEERVIEASDMPASPTDDAEQLHGYHVEPAEQARDRDTALYLHLGYEKELERTEEVSHINRVSNQYVKDEYHRRQKSGLRNTPAVVYDGEEYTAASQTCEKERAYASAATLCKVRLWFTLVFSLVGLGLDILPDFASLLGDGLVDFVRSPLYPIIGFLWLTVSCLPSITYVWGGLRSLWELKPVAYALPAAAIALDLLYTLSACFLVGHGLRLYIGGALVILLVACLGDLLKTVAERFSFRVASSGKAKYILSQAERDVTEGRDEDYVHTFRVRKVERLAHYFLQVTQYDRREWITGLYIAGAFMGGLVVASATVVAGHGAWIQGLSAFMGAYLASLPCAYLLGLTLPLFTANRLIGRHGCTVLTPEAIELYAPGKTVENDAVSITFSSADALKATHVKAVSLTDDEEAGHYRCVTNRLFALLGFPLADGSFTLRDKELKGIRLEIAEIDRTCLRLYMIDRQRDLAYEVLLGTHAAFEERGVRIPPKRREAQYKRTPNSRVLYVAFDRKFRLAYAAEYRPRKSFAQAVKALGSLGYVLSLVNYDPLVTPDLLKSLTTPQMPRLDIIRPDHLEESRESRVSGMMATGRAVDIVYPITACRRMKTATRMAVSLAWIFVILSAGGLGACLTLGIMTHVSSLVLWLWQFFWVGILSLYVKCALRPSRLSMATSKRGKKKTASDK
ncbi:MAG: hypothetical protein E7645_01905 [Ruminococcaceae bacterium]|nr:hypothetical protein [Oscillospiraceae bacterium]